MTLPPNYAPYQQQLEQLSEIDMLRKLQQTATAEPAYCEFNGKKMFNLSSNDYLGLNSDIEFKEQFLQQFPQTAESFHGGSASSRLLTGNSPLYQQLEKEACQWFGAPSTLLFNSGYHANMGILPALVKKGDLILADKLCHASLIDGIRQSEVDFARYRHNDMQHLQQILEKKRQNYQRVFVVSESIFSMDGDRCDLAQLVKLKKQFDLMLYLDEAHSIGALEKQGRGLAAEMNLQHEIDLLVCPLGKAMASLGALVFCHPIIKQVLINRCRTLIFTTALPEINLNWTRFVIQEMSNLESKRQHLRQLIKRMNQFLASASVEPASDFIMPVVVQQNQRAVELANYLREHGVLVFPIRPPTVPKNSARLRLSLTADMTVEDLQRSVQLITEFLSKK